MYYDKYNNNNNSLIIIMDRWMGGQINECLAE